MIDAKKIIVFCSHSATGGPELLHQLVDALRQEGREAYICYYPFHKPFQCHDIYKKYDAPPTAFTDDPDAFYVIPEAATWLINKISHRNAAVWWLSVDNYFGLTHQSWLRDWYRRHKPTRHRVPLRRLRSCKHFVQSAYAAEFLAKAGIESFPLSDFLGSDHLAPRDLALPRRNMVVYNPKKGQKQTAQLRASNPDLEFVPIQNMTPAQVAELVADAKIYVDFGHHPGKDRPPREAAMAGCCVITGRRGAARNGEDVPILGRYKLDESRGAHLKEFRTLADSIFADYACHARDFDRYRAVIAREPEVFREQVRFLFCSPDKR